MRYVRHAPAPPLDRNVDHLWYYDGLEVAHLRERVLPNGTFTLIFNLSETPRCLFPRDLDGPAQPFKRAWVSGAHSAYIVIDSLPNSSLMGVHFHPGGAARFLRIPGGELMDRVVELDAVWGPAASAIHLALLEAPDPQAKLRLLESFLLQRHRALADPDPAIQLALQLFSSQPCIHRIDHVVHATGISHRRFIERFTRQVGLGPKRFCRILRFQQVLQRLQRKQPVSWAALAADCGYYDQAHFIQDFRAFSGMNPSRYLVERGEHLNFVPVTFSR